MRKMFGIPLVLSMLVVPAAVAPAIAGVSVQVSIGAHEGYVPFNELDVDLDWDNMIVINNERIGFWVMGPSGQWVFRCRNMWYDNTCDEWRYGPWWYDYTVSYGCQCHHGYSWGYCPHHAIRFHVYMNRHYPRYHARYFFHDNGHYHRHGARYSNRHDHGPRHSDYSAPRHYSSGPAVRREKSGAYTAGPARESRQTTTVITRESTRPVRTDGGNRVTRTTRPSNDRSVTVVRERSVTRSAPSMQRQGTVRTETRREIRRR